jgi:hypothetical protein
MEQETLGGAIIYYVNGENEQIFFFRDDTTPEGQNTSVERLQNAMQSNLLVFTTTENRMLVIPVSSILKIEVNPAPSKVPEYVIENVKVVSSSYKRKV